MNEQPNNSRTCSNMFGGSDRTNTNTPYRVFGCSGLFAREETPWRAFFAAATTTPLTRASDPEARHCAPPPSRQGNDAGAWPGRLSQHSGGQQLRSVPRDARLACPGCWEHSPRGGCVFRDRTTWSGHLVRAVIRAVDRATILAAVEPNKGNLSVMLSIANAVPAQIIAAIGPAPKVGRPRWSDFAEALQASGAVEAARAALDKADFRDAETDTRFRLIFSAVTVARAAPVSSHSRSILSENGSMIGRVERSARGARMVFEDPAFVDFLAARLAQLHAEFRAVAESRNS